MASSERRYQGSVMDSLRGTLAHQPAITATLPELLSLYLRLPVGYFALRHGSPIRAVAEARER